MSRAWEIYQSPGGKFLIQKLGSNRCEYRGDEVFVATLTNGFDTRDQAETALNRILFPEDHSTFYDAEGNYAE